jgi:peptidoglycan-associated lipoprotein
VDPTLPQESGPLQAVFFSYDSFELSEEARQSLQANADWLQNNAEAKVEVEGHCDDRGTAEYNLALGAKRARAAQDYLTTLGVPAERLSVISYGEELPVCTDSNESCWQRNRRGHFSVLR